VKHLSANQEWCRFHYFKRQRMLILWSGSCAGTSDFRYGPAHISGIPPPLFGGADTMSFVRGDTTMKAAAFALIALSVLVGVAATPANADFAKQFFDHADRFSGGTSGGGG
jgi:hypothetical protein